MLMKRALSTVLSALTIIVAGGVCRAVDVENQDERPYQLQVNIDGNEILIAVPAGETVTGICERCSLSLDGEDSFDAAGDQVATIRDGKLRIQ